MKFRRTDRFEEDLYDSGASYGVTPDALIAEKMLGACGPKIRSKGYKTARNEALEDHLPLTASDNEEKAYKDFIDRFFQRRAQEARKLKHRPFAPVEIDKDDTH